MTTRFATLAFVILWTLAGGCSKSGQSTSLSPNAVNTGAGAAAQSGASDQVSDSDASAIRAAIEDHLRSNRGINLNAMEMTVDSVNVKGDQAQANASFRIKNGGTGMAMKYFLQRSGNGWVVTSGQPADGNTQLPSSNAAPSGVNPSETSPSLPDVDAFLKNHPAQKSN